MSKSEFVANLQLARVTGSVRHVAIVKGMRYAEHMLNALSASDAETVRRIRAERARALACGLC